MNSAPDVFPLQGIIGIVAESPAELEEARRQSLQCVEIRADLLLQAGLAHDQVLELITRARALDLRTLYTLRHPDHGGAFDGSEGERVALVGEALVEEVEHLEEGRLRWNVLGRVRLELARGVWA